MTMGLKLNHLELEHLELRSKVCAFGDILVVLAFVTGSYLGVAAPVGHCCCTCHPGMR